MEMRVTLETAVSIKFNNYSKGKVSVEEFVSTGSVDGVVSFLRDGV